MIDDKEIKEMNGKWENRKTANDWVKGCISNRVLIDNYK